MYKGLQKPLVFKGFKGRFIYWGIGAVASSLMIGIICCIAIDPLVGLLILAILLGGSLFLIHVKQSKGLYDKKCEKGILYVFKNNLK